MMRAHYIDISDMSDSREVMMQKSPRSILWFTVTVFLIVIATVVFSCFGRIDTHISASGEIRPLDSVSSVCGISGGKIVKICAKDGQIVKKGDVIIELDSAAYVDKKASLEAEISMKQCQILNYEKLKESIKKDTNLFDEKTESMFFYQYKAYESELYAAHSEIEESNRQITNSIKELEQIINESESEISVSTSSYNEYISFLILIESDEEYNGENEKIISLQDSYRATYDKAFYVYKGYLLQYESVYEQYQSMPETVDYEAVEQAIYAKDAAYADFLAVKSNFLLQLRETVESLKGQIEAAEKTVRSYTLKLSSLTLNNSYDKIKANIKDNYVLSINNTQDALNSEQLVATEQLSSIEKSILNSKLIAEKDGILMYSKEYSDGDLLSSGEVVCTIIPNQDAYKVILFIPDYNISETFVGQQVEYAIPAAPTVDFGKLYGIITEISEDSILDQSTGQKYYKAVASLPNTVLTDKDGQERVLKSGMVIEAHAITGNKKIATWLLEKLNFI